MNGRRRAWIVRTTKVWESSFMASSREEAIEAAQQHYATEGYGAEDWNTIGAHVARVLRDGVESAPFALEADQAEDDAEERAL